MILRERDARGWTTTKKDSSTWDHWHEILTDLDIPWNAVTGWDLAIGDGLKGDESLPLLVLRNKKYLENNLPDFDANAAAERLASRLQINIRYTSIHNEEFQSESPDPWGPRE